MSMSPPAPGSPAPVPTPVLPSGSLPALPSTSPYAVVVHDYPGPFATQIRIPVVEDKNLKLKPEVRADAQIGTDFEFSLEDALNAASRHLFIRDAAGKNHDNPEEMVEDWLNLLRWEVQTFWTVKPADHWYGETDNPEIYITSEHPRRAGEMLAEGIAVLFAERRLGITRAKTFFYEGTGGTAKPDFVFPLKVKPKYGVVLTNRELYGLEVRSRAEIQSIRSADYKKLLGKKGRKGRKKAKAGQLPPPPVISGVLAVYCSYGPPTKQKKRKRCQIILGDPPEEQAVLADDLRMAEILAVHYIGVTSRVGLWDELRLLQAALVEIRAGRMPALRQPAKLRRVRRVTGRPFGGERYAGRLFSSLLAAVHTGQLTRDEGLARFLSGGPGDFVFHGLNERTIDIINRLNFTELETFFDPNARKGHRGATVGADGSIMMRLEPTADDLRQVEGELRKPPTGRDAVPINMDDESDDHRAGNEVTEPDGGGGAAT